MSSTVAELSPVSPLEVPDPAERYRVGTLQYTKLGLVTLCFWMLWGDFFFSLMELVLPKLLPLQLKDMGASNAMIGLLVGSIPGALNVVCNPVISFRSDRYRSRLGRRIPFLLSATPFIAIFLGMLGYSDTIGRSMHGMAERYFPSLPQTTVILAVVAVLVVLFQFANLFVASVYYYLFNDVVPTAFLGRFLALFRLIGVLAGFVFNRYVFGLSQTHMREIYLCTAALYLVSFLLMCWRVKEGKYPPPPPNIRGPGLISAIRTYFQECSHPFYLLFFSSVAVWTMSATAYALYHFFFLQGLGLSRDEIGKADGWIMLLMAVLLYPMGSLLDRISPLRLYLLAAILTIPTSILFYFFIHGWTSYLVLFLIATPIRVAMQLSSMPLYMEIFPKDRFGQFSSALAIFNSTATIAGTWLAGAFLDLMKNYRLIFVWSVTFQIVAVLLLLAVYRWWLRYGGSEHYRPPMLPSAASPAAD